MAKRFTDTRKRRKAWYRQLSPKLKVAWDTLCDECDHAGVWDIDFEGLSFLVGEEVTRAELVDALGDRVVLIDQDKFFIPGFIEFQYGVLNPAVKVHQSVITRLTSLGLSVIDGKVSLREELPNPSPDLANPSQGVKDKEKEKDKEGESEGKQPTPPVESLRLCADEYLETLRRLGRHRQLRQGEDAEILRAIQRYGFETVRDAFIGVRSLSKSGTYDPAKYVRLNWILEAKQITWLADLALTGQTSAAVEVVDDGDEAHRKAVEQARRAAEASA